MYLFINLYGFQLKMHSPHLSFFSILGICLLLMIGVLVIRKIRKKCFSTGHIIIGIAIATLSTLLSLFVIHQTISGTIEQYQRGWPHQYVIQHLRDVVDHIELDKVVLDAGSGGSFFLSICFFIFVCIYSCSLFFGF
jgi:hypothetical protein